MLLCLSLLLVPAGAQMTSPTALGRQEFPRIEKDGRVTFRIKAPNASGLSVSLGKDYVMSRDAEGVWSATTEPQVEGFHCHADEQRPKRLKQQLAL